MSVGTRLAYGVPISHESHQISTVIPRPTGIVKQILRLYALQSNQPKTSLCSVVETQLIITKIGFGTATWIYKYDYGFFLHNPLFLISLFGYESNTVGKNMSKPRPCLNCIIAEIVPTFYEREEKK